MTFDQYLFFRTRALCLLTSIVLTGAGAHVWPAPAGRRTFYCLYGDTISTAF